MKRLLIVLAAVALFAAGCANSSTSGIGASGSSSAAPGASSAPSPGATGGPSSDASGVPSAGTSTKLTGTLEEGVEPNCVILRATGRDHVLFFLDQKVRNQAKVGDTVTVVGQARPTQITTCQQGIPFLVSAMAVD